MSITESGGAAERRAAGALITRLTYVWTGLYFFALVVAFVEVLGERPGLLGSWLGAAAGLLAAASLALFHGIYLRLFRREGVRWPMSAARALAYFGGQTLILGMLLAIDRSFLGLGFALIGQVFSVLPPSRWPLPVAALALLTAWPIGLYDDLGPGSLPRILSYVFFIVLLVVIGLLIAHLFAQRYRLLGLVEELRRAKAAVEASAAQGEELAVLRERTRLAREMHDSLGHALVLVNVKLEAAQRLYAVDAARGAAELEAVRALVRETMAGLRRSLHDLRAPAAPFHDLPAALRRLGAEVGARGGLRVDARAAEGPPPAVAEPLWWIAREALANVERHARAARAEVSLAREGACWLLTVADDGVGFSPADLARPGHFGVQGMRERAEAAGGSLTIAPGPAGGTRVEARLPAQVVS